MKNLTTAIYSKMGTVGDDFYDEIGGRLYKARAPEDVTWPYVVYDIISNVPADTFSERLEEVVIQFTIFSDASGTTEIEDIFTELKDLYDYCSLSISDNTHLIMQRQSASMWSGDLDADEGGGLYYQYNVDYNILMKAN